MPDTIPVGDFRRWRRREIEAWVAGGCPLRDDFHWRPSVPVKLEQMIAMLSAEAIELLEQVRALEGRRARGETMTLVAGSP